jgi:hypothetical protein
MEFQLIEVKKMKMLLIRFDSIVNLIQMTWMKVISDRQNMMLPEFQHSVEFHLIESDSIRIKGKGDSNESD